MRKPDPTRIIGRGKRTPDKLEMKGFSSPTPVIKKEEENPIDTTRKAGTYTEFLRAEHLRPTRKAKKKTKLKKAKIRHRDTMTPRHHETTVSRYHETIIETVRKAVKDFGKEAATYRFTLEEKKALADIIYAYKSQGTQTSENEITRIAVNFIVNDYRDNGKNSILDRVLRALEE